CPRGNDEPQLCTCCDRESTGLIVKDGSSAPWPLVYAADRDRYCDILQQTAGRMISNLADESLPGNGQMVAVGTRISPRPPHRSRRALLTHRAPPSGQTSCDERFSYARRLTRSHHSDRRGISAQCPNRGRLTAVPLG